MDEDRQGTAPAVPDTATQGAEAQGRNRPDLNWVEASIWTERMVSARAPSGEVVRGSPPGRRAHKKGGRARAQNRQPLLLACPSTASKEASGLA
jgi:hypothetical protein